MCVSIFLYSICPKTFPILRNERDIIKMYIGLHVKCPLFLSSFKESWIFLTDFKKKSPKYQISRKYVHWEPSCSMWADRRMDRHDAILQRHLKIECKFILTDMKVSLKKELLWEHGILETLLWCIWITDGSECARLSKSENTSVIRCLIILTMTDSKCVLMH